MMNQFEQLLQVLPKDFQQQSYEHQAFQRARKVQSPLQLFQLLMLYCGADYSLRVCAGIFSPRCGVISDEAIKKRLCQSTQWIKSLLSQVLGLDEVRQNESLRFIVIDGSTVQERGATQMSYRLHLAMDLLNLKLTQAIVTTDKIGENLQHYQIQSGDVIIADRGYSTVQTIMPVVDQGADVIIRYAPYIMPLYTENPESHVMEQVQWQALLSQCPNQSQVIKAYMVQGNKRIAVYVHALPKQASIAEQERQQLLRAAKRKKRTVKEQTLYMTNWTLILSSVSPKIINTVEISNIYKARWQIELSIKRLKSILNIDHLRAKKHSLLAEVYLLGKLLYASLLEKLLASHFPSSLEFGRFNPKRNLSDWRLLLILQEHVKLGLLSLFPLGKKFSHDMIYNLTERPRKRKLQRLDDGVYNLIQRVG